MGNIEKELEEFRVQFARVRTEVAKIIVGQDDVVTNTLICLLAVLLFVAGSLLTLTLGCEALIPDRGRTSSTPPRTEPETSSTPPVSSSPDRETPFGKGEEGAKCAV